MTKTIVGTAVVLLALPLLADAQSGSQRGQQNKPTFSIQQQITSSELTQMSSQLRTKIEQAIEVARREAGQQAQVIDATLTTSQQGPHWSVLVVDDQQSTATYYNVDGASGQLLSKSQLDFRGSSEQQQQMQPRR